jgi:hypothetical protein
MVIICTTCCKVKAFTVNLLRMIQNKHHLGSLGITGFLDFIHCLTFERTLKNTTFRKLDFFSALGEGVGGTLLGRLGGVNFNHSSDTGRWTKSQNSVIPGVMNHDQNPSVSTRTVCAQRDSRYDNFVCYRKLKIESSDFRMPM